MDSEKLTEAVNKSGFPLQIGLEHIVNESRADHGWQVIYSEHSWKNAADGSSGFIDLVLKDKYGTSVLIVESKRVQESSWIFLVDNLRQMSRRQAKAWLMRYRDNKFSYFGLKELTLEPSTPESQYCVVDGQDPKSRPMLERIAADIASSAEGFANEEKGLHLKDREVFRMYFNVIVTTAKLQVCLFDPENVSIEDGRIQHAEYKEVPYLRFRKQLINHYEVPEQYAVAGHREIARAKESTVFVVNASSFLEFLKEFDVDDFSVRGTV